MLPFPTSLSAIGSLAVDCLRLEVATYPKPGLVSHVDSGAHDDMDAALLRRSADTLAPFFTRLSEAGAAGHDMDRLRVIGIETEHAMFAATGGINTHRGAIFGLGLLQRCRGLSARLALARRRAWVTSWWRAEAAQILAGPVKAVQPWCDCEPPVWRGGARLEAATGFPALYAYGMPALRQGRSLAPQDEEAARVQLCMALIARLEDTNLLHRGGTDGLNFARQAAREFLMQGGVGRVGWQDCARAIHQAFVARNLSPGGSADLLAMTPGSMPAER